MEAVTLEQRTDMVSQLHAVNDKAWPRFMLNWRCPDWAHLYSTFDGYQVLLLDDNGSLAAFGHTIPLCLVGNLKTVPDNLRVLIETAVKGNTMGAAPNILLALAVVVSESRRGGGLSVKIIGEMKNLALSHGLQDLIIPVRPTGKTEYPLVSIAEYARWRRSDGLPFDSWLRVHARLGGRILKTAEASMVIRGTVEEWEKWTGVEISGSGSYNFVGALSPVQIDFGMNIGIYRDPCVWVHYRFGR